MRKQHNYFNDLLTLGTYYYDETVLKKNYRKLARETHPDAEKGNDEKFKHLKDAYDNLKMIPIEEKELLSNLNKSQFAYNVLGVKVMIDLTRVQRINETLKQLPLSETSKELLTACYKYISLKGETQEVTYILANNIYKGISV